MLLDDGHGVQGVLLGEFGLDLGEDGSQVRDILLGLGPLVLGEQLVGVAALDGAADAVDTLVGLLGGQTLQGDLDSFVFLLEEIVVSQTELAVAGSARIPIGSGRQHLGQPRPLQDVRSERDHVGRTMRGGEREEMLRENRIGLFRENARNGMIRRTAKVGRARDVTCKVLKVAAFLVGVDYFSFFGPQ